MAQAILAQAILASDARAHDWAHSRPARVKMVTMYSRPRLRDPRRCSTWSRLAVGMAAVALALALTRSSSAFATSSATAVAPKVQGPPAAIRRPAAAPAVAADALPGAGRTAGGTALSCLGCAALLLASAVHHARGGKVRKPSQAVVACRAAPAFVSAAAPAAAPVAAPPPPAIASTLPQESVEPGHLIDTAAAEAPVVMLRSAPSEGATTLLAGVSIEAAPQVTPRRQRASAARFFGGARHARGRVGAGRRAAAAQRTARRSIGARLQSVQPAAEVLPVPFDPSRLETKIQMGLRTSSRLRLVRGREVKTPSSSQASCKSSLAYLMGIHFLDRLRSSLHQPD
uniref:Uncharacterized protein n=1 Tax=Alexandrium monilatum TaxID=311494 RepID=A0A7S4SQT9_9DINO